MCRGGLHVWTKRRNKKNLEYLFEKNLGIKYEEYEQLDFDEQQKLINEHHKRTKGKKNVQVTVMNGLGEHAIFTKVQKGDRIMVGSGEHSCFVRTGITPEESRRELDDKLDDLIYSKPVAFVKKLQRRLKK